MTLRNRIGLHLSSGAQPRRGTSRPRQVREEREQIDEAAAVDVFDEFRRPRIGNHCDRSRSGSTRHMLGRDAPGGGL